MGGLASALHRHATDGPSEWRIDLDARADAAAVPVRAMADGVIRGRESDLLAWLTNRPTGSWKKLPASAALPPAGPGSAADRLTDRVGLGQLTQAHIKVVSGGPDPSLLIPGAPRLDIAGTGQ